MVLADVRVPFFDWRALYGEHAEEFARILDETASAGGFILQSEVEAFESALAETLGVRHVIGLSDCTNAMLLGLRALDLPRGSEIILPAHAFIAAAQAIHHSGSVPIPVDVRRSDWLLDPEAVRAAITPATRAIMAVHVNGRVCEMDALRALADEHGLLIVEDAAQALGATYRGAPAGRFGAWSAFSFYPSKTLGGFGDAGALATDDDAIAATVRAMRNHGAGADKVISADCTIWGTNARLDNLHAAILLAKLADYDAAIARRRAVARSYHEAFRQLAGLDLPPGPDAGSDRFDIFQNYEICCDARDALRSHLAARGIGTIVQWGGNGLNHFHGLGMGRVLPVTDRFMTRALLLPMNHLLDDHEVDAVIEAVRSFFR
jgi:dTDP-4-amino-4,6-dideoxygalactose transaminase